MQFVGAGSPNHGRGIVGELDLIDAGVLEELRRACTAAG